MNSDHRTTRLDLARLTERRRWITAIALIVTAGAVIRCLAVIDDFWLDEIWSLTMAMNASSVWEILQTAHDNNHHLNTLFLYLLGPRDGWIPYRWLSLVCGMGTIILGLLLGLRRGRLVALTTGLLLSLSFFMIVYSTEARGYSPAGFFALLCFLVLEKALERETCVRVLLWGALVILGFSSHFSFGIFYLAALAWSAIHCLRSSRGYREWVFRWARLHALPLVYLVFLYLLVLRRLHVGGGPEWNWAQVLDETIGWSIGYPLGVVPLIVPALGLMAALTWDAWKEQKEGSSEWVFYAFVILLSPIATLIVSRPDYLFPRYFFISIVFLLIMLARCIARVAAKGRAGRIVAALLVGVFCVGNGSHIVPFLRYGRGQYGDAIRYMAENTQVPVVSVASDHDFRNRMVVNFHARSVLPDKKIVYCEMQRVPSEGVNWILTHSQARNPQSPQVLRLPTGHFYTLRKEFRHYGPSGWHWFLYERVPPSSRYTGGAKAN